MILDEKCEKNGKFQRVALHRNDSVWKKAFDIGVLGHLQMIQYGFSMESE